MGRCRKCGGYGAYHETCMDCLLPEVPAYAHFVPKRKIIGCYKVGMLLKSKLNVSWTFNALNMKKGDIFLVLNEVKDPTFKILHNYRICDVELYVDDYEVL